MRSASGTARFCKIEQDLPERGLGGLLLARRRRDRRHLRDVPRPLPLLPRDAAVLDQGAGRFGRIAAKAGIRLPLLPFRDAHPLAQRGDLAGVHQAGMIVLVAGKGQPLPFHRISDEQGGHVVLGSVKSFDQALHVVAC
jgi:hypothetical protein